MKGRLNVDRVNVCMPKYIIMRKSKSRRRRRGKIRDGKGMKDQSEKVSLGTDECTEQGIL